MTLWTLSKRIWSRDCNSLGSRGNRLEACFELTSSAEGGDGGRTSPDAGYLFGRGLIHPKDAVRTEEFINYFKTRYEPPRDGEAFAIYTEMAPSPFAHEPQCRLLEVGVEAREVRAHRAQTVLAGLRDR